MSDADQHARDWHLYVQDMIAFSQKVLSYTEGRQPGFRLALQP